MGLIEKIFKVFLHFKSMRAIDHLGLGQFAPKGLDWQDFKWGSTRHCHILNIYGFRFFFSIIHVAILISWAWPVLTPRA